MLPFALATSQATSVYPAFPCKQEAFPCLLRGSRAFAQNSANRYNMYKQVASTGKKDRTEGANDKKQIRVYKAASTTYIHTLHKIT